MNTISSKSIRPAGKRLSLGILTLFTAATVAASAATQKVEMNLGGKQFGHAKALEANSTTKTIAKSKLYQYQISGTIRGKGTDLGALLPVEIPLSDLFNTIKPGSAAILTGQLANPTGTLPAQLFSQTIGGTRKINGQTIKAQLKFSAAIAANGQLSVSLTNITLQRKVGTKLVPLRGTLVFGKGSKLVASTAPIVEFKATGQPAFAETAGQAKIIVWRQGNPAAAASVSYTTVDGTAKAGTDYTTTSGTIQFNAGEVNKEISIPLVAGATKLGYRTFTVTLSNPGSGTVLGSKLTNTIAIKADL